MYMNVTDPIVALLYCNIPLPGSVSVIVVEKLYLTPPTTPEDPLDPELPLDPEEPDVPEEPEEPDVPLDPLLPEVPLDPDDPDVPEEPDEPFAPDAPSKLTFHDVYVPDPTVLVGVPN